MVLSRRSLIVGLPAVLLARTRSIGARQGGLGRFVIEGGQTCEADPQPTPAVAPDGTFREGAPERSVLADAGVGDTRLVFAGTVIGMSCGHLAGVRVDLWHADGQGAYDPDGFRYRGHQRTDGNGTFRFETIVPGATDGRAPHLGIRVRVDGQADFRTELFFPDEPRNATDARFRPELVLEETTGAGRRSTRYDVRLDI